MISVCTAEPWSKGLIPAFSPSGLVCTIRLRLCSRAMRSRNAIISLNFQVVSMCRTGNGTGLGKNALRARCSRTDESLPIEYIIAATDRVCSKPKPCQVMPPGLIAALRWKFSGVPVASHISRNGVQYSLRKLGTPTRSGVSGRTKPRSPMSTQRRASFSSSRWSQNGRWAMLKMRWPEPSWYSAEASL